MKFLPYEVHIKRSEITERKSLNNLKFRFFNSLTGETISLIEVLLIRTTLIMSE